jgi:hypothetical protein
MVIDDRVVERNPTIPAPVVVRRASRRRWPVVAGIVALCAASLGYITGNEVQSNTQFDGTHHSLVVTTHRIDTVLADLATVRQDLHLLNGQVATDSAALDQDTTQLQAVQKALASARTTVANQTSTIGNLEVCLGGVEQALNALAVADQNRAIQALDAVSASCASAVASGG